MNYIGIDLGTTNSAICSYDGETIRLYKSPEQHDVTPSAIFFDRRGNVHVGARAYQNAARNPDSAATLFKRLMGTSTPVKIAALDRVMAPEECSAMILRALFGYLPEEIRAHPEVGTVITVPAAFNQMQKDATVAAAEAAGIGGVALMQEPVAAVMSIMRQRASDGLFMIFDLGGGTLDVAIAEGIAGRVNLLAHGGIAMCGGRDFDRALFANCVRPWLVQNFDLPDNFTSDPVFKPLLRLSMWATEKAKIELSSREETTLNLSETELSIKDLSGQEVYLDINISRRYYDDLIRDKVSESIIACRETLDKASVTPHDVDRIVFVGGPTHYKPLRDHVSFELGIAPSFDVNPMTAVAEGAAVFAESIDWTSRSRGRKSTRGSIRSSTVLELDFDYVARTPDARARILAKVQGSVAEETEFQIDSLDTGWTSGRMPLRDRAEVLVPLARPGENTFKVFVFDASGSTVKLSENRITISRTAASVDAIPASHSIGIEAREKIGGPKVLVYLVRAGDHLPRKGQLVFRAEEALRAGSSGALRFKLWEGDIAEPIADNRFVGSLIIRGSDFEDGVIAQGAEMICSYEIRDSGAIDIEVAVPTIGASFPSGRNFYSRQDAQIDYSQASRLIAEESDHALERIRELESRVNDPRLDIARSKLERVSAASSADGDPESAKQAMDDVQEVKRILAQARKDHLETIRQMELDHVRDFFDKAVREHARPSEVTSFENLLRTAQRAIDKASGDFEAHLSDLHSRTFAILWRQEWFIVERFRWLAEASHLFPSRDEHTNLVVRGQEALRANDIDMLRSIVIELDSTRIGSLGDDEMLAASNIIRS